MKIRTFRDEEELPKGEFIGPVLIQAITESKVYIPIISRNYASSKWCLQELAKMGGRHSNPVFEQHDPRDVRHPESNPVFEQHDPKHDPEIVKVWKEALQEVGKMKGWHVTELDG
ncbi:Disease resistance protein L6 [Linum grandiflorum]